MAPRGAHPLETLPEGGYPSVPHLPLPTGESLKAGRMHGIRRRDPHAHHGKDPVVPWLLAYLAVANLVSFAMFGADKTKARSGQRRTSERALLTSAAVSGTVGAWIGMRVFRHKTAKCSFQVKMMAVTALDIVVLVAVLALR